MESIEQTFNGQADFGRRVTYTISIMVIYRTYLQVTLPEISQNHLVRSTQMVRPRRTINRSVEIEIGGQRIDRQYGDWMHIWNRTHQKNKNVVTTK